MDKLPSIGTSQRPSGEAMISPDASRLEMFRAMASIAGGLIADPHYAKQYPEPGQCLVDCSRLAEDAATIAVALWDEVVRRS